MLLPSEKGNVEQYIKNIPIIKVPLLRLRKEFSLFYCLTFLYKYIFNIIQIYRIIKKENFDIVQLNGFANIQGALAAKLAGKKVIIQIIDTYTPSFIIKIYSFFINSLCDIFMSTGKNVAIKHLSTHISSNKITYFFPPVNFKKINPSNYNKLKEKLVFSNNPNDFIIGTLGNVNKQKGHDYFINIAAALKMKINNVKFLIIGSAGESHSDYLKELKSLCIYNNLTIDKDIFFVDPKGDVGKYLSVLDLFWFTSVPNSEGIPTAIEEAMTFGLPIISTNVGSIEEIIKNKITGFVINYGDTKSFVRKTILLFNDKILYNKIAKNCRKFARESFSINSCAKKHIIAFNKALS